MDNSASNQDLKLFELQAGRFSLVPLTGKRPFEQGWEKWCETKREFNRRDFEGHNAGVCCGPASGVLVLDVDDPQAFEALLVGNGLAVPETYTVITGSGKPHYYFRYPQGGVRVGNKSFKHPVFPRHTIYDIRGVGGQVVAAGSIHPETGQLYRVEKLIAIAQPPDWLLSCNNDGLMNMDAVLEIPLPEPKDREFIESLKVSQEIRELILQGVPKDQRSDQGMKVINALLGAGYNENTVFFVFNHYAIGDRYRNDTGADKARWLRREIESSRGYLGRQQNAPRPAVVERPAQPALDELFKELDQTHSVVMINGNCRVMNEFLDPLFNQLDISFSSTTDFKNYYANRRIRINPDDAPVGVAKLWLESPQRRDYKGIIFSPGKDVEGYYNLYRGFAIEPKPGDWSLFQSHIREVIASGDESCFNYVMAWMAQLLQQPGGERPGTAIVLRGKQGTGKSIFATQFGRIFGRHFLHITNQGQLTGRFNFHFKDALLVFSDEGIWAGDKRAEGVLKGMITEDRNLVEAKGKDILSVKNHIRLIVASNNSWVVPAGLEERRFFVLDISDKHMQDHEYFGNLVSQMNNGGREAMLHDLLQYDYSEVDLRRFPRTEALMDQAVNSMSPVEKFWYDRLREGTLSKEDDQWNGHVPTEDLYREYIEYAKQIGSRFLLSDSQFGKEIQRLCPQKEKRRPKSEHPNYGNGRKWHYFFPALEQCREAFEKLVNIQVQWS